MGGARRSRLAEILDWLGMLGRFARFGCRSSLAEMSFWQRAALVAFGIAAEKSGSISPSGHFKGRYSALSSLTPGDFEAPGVRWIKASSLTFRYMANLG